MDHYPHLLVTEHLDRNHVNYNKHYKFLRGNLEEFQSLIYFSNFIYKNIVLHLHNLESKTDHSG